MYLQEQLEEISQVDNTMDPKEKMDQVLRRRMRLMQKRRRQRQRSQRQRRQRMK